MVVRGTHRSAVRRRRAAPGRFRRSLACTFGLAAATGVLLGAGGRTAAAPPDTAMQQLTDNARAGFDTATLPRGSHHMTKFVPGYRFSLARPTPASALLPWFTDATLAGSERNPRLQLAFWSDGFDLLDPAVEQSDLAVAKADPGVPRTVDGILAWLKANPRVTISGRRSITIGGAKGTEVLVRPKPGKSYASDLCATSCVGLFVTPPLRVSRNHGDWVAEGVGSENPVRLDLLTVHGKLLMVMTDVVAGDFAQSTKVAKQFLSTVRFD